MQNRIWVIETRHETGSSSVGCYWWESEQAAWDHVAKHDMRRHFDTVVVYPLDRYTD